MSDSSAFASLGQAGRRVVRVANRYTGEVMEIDSQLARVRRLRFRVARWADYIRHVGLSKWTMKMVTLTYADVDGWRPNHISDFMGHVRRHCGKNLGAYAWVSELQERGAVHYHILLIVKPGQSLPYPDNAGWWSHGYSRIETAHSPGYVVKYSSKGVSEDQIFPKGLRLYSVWVGKSHRDEQYEDLFRVSALPGWLRPHAIESEEFPKRSPGGGWFVKLFGLSAVIVSPFVLVSVSRLIQSSPG